MADQPGVGHQALHRLVRHRPHPARVEPVKRESESIEVRTLAFS
jgi:hypothetical protein